VPERLTFRFDRRLTIGEAPEQALRDVDSLDAVRTARAAGLRVEVAVPRYALATWRGYPADNPQLYRGWLTPEDHPAIRAALAAYRGVVTPHVVEPPGGARGGALRREPRVDRWIFSTDGVGFPVPASDDSIPVAEAKRWVVSGDVKHPAMLGVGPGLEQNTHRIGECVDLRELRHAIALLARFPSAFAATAG
jgi:acetylornithine deacetylase/succinyl-diaminopimelate desuccinylase-like protein